MHQLTRHKPKQQNSRKFRVSPSGLTKREVDKMRQFSKEGRVCLGKKNSLFPFNVRKYRQKNFSGLADSEPIQ